MFELMGCRPFKDCQWFQAVLLAMPPWYVLPRDLNYTTFRKNEKTPIIWVGWGLCSWSIIEDGYELWNIYFFNNGYPWGTNNGLYNVHSQVKTLKVRNFQRPSHATNLLRLLGHRPFLNLRTIQPHSPASAQAQPWRPSTSEPSSTTAGQIFPRQSLPEIQPKPTSVELPVMMSHISDHTSTMYRVPEYSWVLVHSPLLARHGYHGRHQLTQSSPPPCWSAWSPLTCQTSQEPHLAPPQCHHSPPARVPCQLAMGTPEVHQV